MGTQGTQGTQLDIFGEQIVPENDVLAAVNRGRAKRGVKPLGRLPSFYEPLLGPSDLELIDQIADETIVGPPTKGVV